MRCFGWNVVVPKTGEIHCSFDGIVAEQGGTCLVQCDDHYTTETETIRCIEGTGWVPTRKPECSPDGSLTIIIVPSVVGAILFIFLVTFICLRTSNRCQRSTRAHDEDEDVEVGRRRGQTYMMNTSKRPGGHDKFSKEYSKKDKLNKNKSLEKKKRRRKSLSKRWNNLSLKNTVNNRFRNGTMGTRAFVRRGVKTVKSPWRRKGPRRVVGRSQGVGNSSVCEECHHMDDVYPPAKGDATSCCSQNSSLHCSLEPIDYVCDDDQEKETAPSCCEKAVALPPIRPPPPTIISRKASPKTNAKIIESVGAEVVERRRKKKSKSASSGYSSDEMRRKKRKQKKVESEKKQRRKRKEAEKRRKRKNKIEEKENNNPFDNYPAAASDRKYEDLENDYRKTGHIYDEGGYRSQVQYHIKAYPVKPVRKKDTKESSENESETEKKNSVPTGGVKYYSIKPDKDEIKKLKRETRKKSQKSDYSKRKESRKYKREKNLDKLRKSKVKRRKEKRKSETIRDESKSHNRNKSRTKRKSNSGIRDYSSDED